MLRKHAKRRPLVLHGEIQLETAHRALLLTNRNPALLNEIEMSLDTLGELLDRTTSDDERINFAFIASEAAGRTALKDVLISLHTLVDDPTQPDTFAISADALIETLAAK